MQVRVALARLRVRNRKVSFGGMMASADDGASWGNPFVPTLSPPLTATQVTRGDIASIVTVGNKVGIMWNNSKEKAIAHTTLNFALHDSSNTSGAWAAQVIIEDDF